MKLKLIVKCLIGICLLITFSGCGNSDSQISQNNSSVNADEKAIIKAEKIEIVHFHATQQCSSCIKVGELALKTIKEKFPDEYSSGKIVFKDINGELPENTDIVVKYQARGSSLFINAITPEKEFIIEDTKVWRLISDEKSFKDYFGNLIDAMLI